MKISEYIKWEFETFCSKIPSMLKSIGKVLLWIACIYLTGFVYDIIGMYGYLGPMPYHTFEGMLYETASLHEILIMYFLMGILPFLLSVIVFFSLTISICLILCICFIPFLICNFIKQRIEEYKNEVEVIEYLNGEDQ